MHMEIVSEAGRVNTGDKKRYGITREQVARKEQTNWPVYHTR